MKTDDLSNRSRILCQTLCFVFLLSLTMSATAATSYLEELNAEAASNDQTESNSPQAAQPNWTEQQPVGNHEKLDEGLSKEEFEKTLKSRFYGSYLFYSALSDTKQAVVYEEYKKNNDIEHLREVIKQQMTN